MSSTNQKGKNKPSKRIEYRCKNVRVSRTGGVSATKTFKGEGVGATINTNHGIRIHKRLFKGARMGFQNGNFQFIGRYVDVRVSTLPSYYGERIVLRLLDKQASQINIEDRVFLRQF